MRRLFRPLFLSILLTLTLSAARAHIVMPPSLSDWMKLEAATNRDIDTFKIVALNNYQSSAFSPESAQYFTVKSFWIDHQKVTSFRVGATDLPEYFVDQKNKRLLLLVHPESESFYKDLTSKQPPGPEFWALSTASSRTLLVSPKSQPDLFFFAKLSLNKEVAGVVRTIPRSEVSRSLGVTKLLDHIGNGLPKSFLYLPEVFGLMPHDFERGGMIIREIPQPLLKKGTLIMPVFSLYTQQTDGTIPMIEMSRKQNTPLREWLETQLLRPFARLYWDLLLNQRLAIEAHAQNFLVVIRDNKLTGEFVFRDFGGFNFDIVKRIEMGLPTPKELPYFVSLEKDYFVSSHLKAAKDSVSVYFEGGVLFGLSKVTSQMDKNLNYEDLKSIFRKIMSEEAKKLGVQFSASDAAYSSIKDIVEQSSKKSCKLSVAN